jgi:uncharacterized membrane protein
MRFEVSEEIAAPQEQVWRVLSEVVDWPHWCPTMTSVRRLDSGPLAFASAARVRQPRLPTALWRITEFEPGSRFEWSSTALGVTTRGGHRVERLGERRSRVTLTLAQRGALAPLLGLLYGRLSRRYISLEAASLKHRCESAPMT